MDSHSQNSVSRAAQATATIDEREIIGDAKAEGELVAQAKSIRSMDTYAVIQTEGGASQSARSTGRISAEATPGY